MDYQGLKTTLAEKISQNLRCRESLNSSGTVSRKTSTASEYTPEHTYIHDSRAHFVDQPNVSYSTESCISITEGVSMQDPKTVDEIVLKRNMQNDSSHSQVAANGDIKQSESFVVESGEIDDQIKIDDDENLKSGQKVDLKIILLRQDSQLATSESSISIDAEQQGLTEADSKTSTEQQKSDVDVKETETESQNSNSKLKVPQRKISRFLVSPVFSGKLDLPKDKDYGDGEVTKPAEEPAQLTSNVEMIETKTPAPLKIDEKKAEPENKTQETTQKTEEAKVCGPEMINTLEQLKISLQNLTHSHSSHKKDSNEGSDLKAQGGSNTPQQQVKVPQMAGVSPKPQQSIQPSQQPPQAATVIQSGQQQLSTSIQQSTIIQQSQQVRLLIILVLIS